MKLSKPTKNIKSPGWNKVKLSRASSKNTLKVIFLTEAIKVWHTSCDSKTASASASRVSFNHLSSSSKIITFLQLHSVVWQLILRQPLSSCVVSRWRFWSSLAILAMFSTRPNCLEWPSDWDGRFGPMDFHRKAQQKMAPWYFSMAKVASQT